ncbi:Lipoyl(octanoyl) transferase [Psidium guajava]|nr:Lipoyl(octanoyl) transferase [Psidium guajava]
MCPGSFWNSARALVDRYKTNLTVSLMFLGRFNVESTPWLADYSSLGGDFLAAVKDANL